MIYFLQAADEAQYRCTSNRRANHFDQKRRNTVIEKKTNMGKFMEIFVALMAVLAISIFFGIFLFLFITFMTLGKYNMKLD